MYGLRIARVFNTLTALCTALIVSTASAQNPTQSSNLRSGGDHEGDQVSGLLEFNAKPNKCVALRKGQVCYQRVLLRFKSPVKGDYCLHAGNNDKPVQCWSNVNAGKYRYELESSENVNFTLHDSAGRVAVAVVTIAWVYKNSSRRRTSWRIF